MECPGGEQSCEIRNTCDLTPAEIAENAGHSRLAQTLRSYMEMNDISNMYHIMKGMTEKTNPAEDNDEYLLPRPLGETYSVPPSARPFSPPSSLPLPITGYMEMNSSKHSSKSSNISLEITQITTPVTTPNELDQKPPTLEKKEIQSTYHNFYTNTLRKQNSIEKDHQKPTKIIEDHVQSELAEIINDFKNNVFTIQEVEKLVENWRNRNDVQQSFKDKQDALLKMREEYERIQKLMKDDDTKRSTPFDRLKRFFSRSKSSKHHHDQVTPNGKEQRNSNSSSASNQSSQCCNNSKTSTSCQSHRPVSSLSQSSSSKYLSRKSSKKNHDLKCGGQALFFDTTLKQPSPL